MDLREWNRRKNNWLRIQKGKWISGLLGKASENASTYRPEAVHKVLVLRNDARLGDAVAGSSLLRGLRQLFPQATIDVVACKNTAAVFQASTFVNRVWYATESIYSLISCGLKLRHEKYDLFIDVDIWPMLSGLVFLKCLAPRWAVGLNREKFPLYNLSAVKDLQHIHITQRYEALLRRLGLTGPFDPSYFIELPAHVRQEAKTWVDQQFNGQEFWVFNPLASSWKKSFTMQQIVAICNHFAHKNIVLVGAENPLQKEIQGQVLPANVRIYCDKDVLHSLAVATHANLLFTPDTFWVHAACALHIPTVSVFNFVSPQGGAYRYDPTMEWSPLEKEVRMFVYPGQQRKIPAQRLIEVIETY